MIGNRYSQTSLRQAAIYNLENCFFKVTSQIFQVAGIPVSSDSAPFFANPFLFHYESKWIGKMKNIDNALGMYTDS